LTRGIVLNYIKVKNGIQKRKSWSEIFSSVFSTHNHIPSNTNSEFLNKHFYHNQTFITQTWHKSYSLGIFIRVNFSLLHPFRNLLSCTTPMYCTVKKRNNFVSLRLTKQIFTKSVIQWAFSNSFIISCLWNLKCGFSQMICITPVITLR